MGANTILAHFHYCCKGQKPFNPEFSWDAASARKMAELNDKQLELLKRYQSLVEERGK